MVFLWVLGMVPMATQLQATFRGFEAAVHAEGHEAVPRHLTCRTARNPRRSENHRFEYRDDENSNNSNIIYIYIMYVL